MTRKLQSTSFHEWAENHTDLDGVSYQRKPRHLTEFNYLFEKNQFHSMLLILSNPNPDQKVVNQCSTLMAHRLRMESWNKDLRAVTVAVPMELMEEVSTVECREDNHPNIHLGYVRCQSDPSI